MIFFVKKRFQISDLVLFCPQIVQLSTGCQCLPHTIFYIQNTFALRQQILPEIQKRYNQLFVYIFV